MRGRGGAEGGLFSLSILFYASFWTPLGVYSFKENVPFVQFRGVMGLVWMVYIWRRLHRNESKQYIPRACHLSCWLIKMRQTMQVQERCHCLPGATERRRGGVLLLGFRRAKGNQGGLIFECIHIIIWAANVCVRSTCLYVHRGMACPPQ